MIEVKALLEQKPNPADLDAIKTLVDSDATMEDLRQAATWHALHARVQRIEEALIAQDRHRKAMPK